MIPCSTDEIFSIAGADAVVRGVGGVRRGPSWRSGDGRAVAYTGLDEEGLVGVLVALGPCAPVAELVTAVRGEVPVRRVIVPRGTPLPLAEPVEWDFRAASRLPPRRPHEGLVAWEPDGEAISRLLRRTSPGSSVWPGDGAARRWAGIREEGRLVACLADTTSVARVGHVSAIAVEPGEQGRGLGSSITAWAMRRLLGGGCDMVTLGVYAGGTTAPRMYARLGFTVDHAFTTGVLPA